MTGWGTAFYVASARQSLIWAVIGISGAAAVLGGAVINRPRRRSPWLWLAGGVLAFSATDTIDNLVTGTVGQEVPFPSHGDVIYTITFILLAAGLMNLARSGATGYDRAGLLDVLTVAVSLALLAWVVLFEAHAQTSAWTVGQKVTTLVYILEDVLLVTMAARILVTNRNYSTAPALALGTIGLLTADAIYTTSRLSGSWQPGGVAEIGWLVFYVAWGVAALHPSMVALTGPRTVRPTELGGRRLLLLTLASLIAPAVLLVQATRGPVHSGVVIATSSAALFLLVLARLAGLANSRRQALTRERVLRESSAALVAATNQAQVEAVAAAAAGRMLRTDTPHRIAVGSGATFWDNPRTSPGRTGEPYLARRTELSRDDAARLYGFDLVLVCPLVVPDEAAGSRQLGALLVAAPEPELMALSGTLSVLASPAALALERISLSVEIARRSSEEYFRTLVRNATDVILIVNDDGTLRYASPSAAALFGTEPAVGSTLDGLVPPAQRGRADPSHRPGSGPPARVEDTDWTVCRADGTDARVEAFHRDLRDDPSIRGTVLTLRDVTEQRRLEQELRHRAFHDALTGLANRALFYDRLNQAVARSRALGTTVGVLFIDVDDLKIINDVFGHAAGDQLLVAVAGRLRDAVGPRDTAARLGGDEFAVMLDEMASASVAETVAQTISTALAVPIRVGETAISSSASIGLATTAEAADPEELVLHADLALYVAKASGKGQWRRYHATQHGALVRRLSMRGELDRGLADNAFSLMYQPIVELDTGTVAGFEALLRWNHPTRGEVPPNELIAVAEESGLIVPLGEWVLSTAMADAARWARAQGRAGPYLSVNVSPMQFRSAGLTERISDMLDRTGVAPTSLMLEITESVLLHDDERVWANLRRLREFGVRVAIDDFGTGYSSLGYLRRMSVDVLKIDKSFIEAIASSSEQRALVETLLHLARTLGLDVIAEGVEEPAQRDILLDMGCRYGQGYLLARALSYDDAVRYATRGLGGDGTS